MKKGIVGTVTAAIVGVLALIGRILWDVFSWAGIGYALGLSDGADLAFPTVTAVVFWLLTVLVPLSVAVTVTRRLDWREAILEPKHWVDAWLAAWVSLKLRTQRRVQWAWAGWDNHLEQQDRAAALAYDRVPVKATPTPQAMPVAEVGTAA